MPTNDYLYHKPDEAGIKAIASIRRIFVNAEKAIEAELKGLGIEPERSRDFSLAKTNLKQSMMWANSAVALNYPGEELPDANT